MTARHGWVIGGLVACGGVLGLVVGADVITFLI